MKKKTTEEFKKQMQVINPDIEIVGEYQGNKIKIACKCKKCNHEWEARPDNLLRWGCPKCRLIKIGNKNRKSLQNFINDAVKVHGNKYDYSKVEYLNNNTKVCIICPEHGEFWQTPANHLCRHGCPKCNQSRGELLIETFLKENEVEYIPQYKIRIDSTINCSGEAKVDFFLPKYNTFIEYNGVQHYVAKEYFGGALQLKHQQSRDLYVKEYCTSNNINLIIIPYTLTDSQIINICKQILE